MTQDNAPKTVTKRLRFEIFRRDGFRCFYCGLPANETGEGLTIDHVVPVSLGGSNDPSNLVAACKDCNSGKTSSGPDEAHVAQVADDAVRWAAALQQAAETRQNVLHAGKSEVRAFEDEWEARRMGWRPQRWEGSIQSFIRSGLTADDLEHFTGVAERNVQTADQWRYFCGCCWKEIERRREMAAQILGLDPPPVAPEPAPTEPEATDAGDASFPFWELGYDMHDWIQSELVVASIALPLARFGGVDAKELLDGWRDWISLETAPWAAPSDFEAAMEATAGGHVPAEAWG